MPTHNRKVLVFGYNECGTFSLLSFYPFYGSHGPVSKKGKKKVFSVQRKTRSLTLSPLEYNHHCLSITPFRVLVIELEVEVRAFKLRSKLDAFWRVWSE